MRRRTVVLGGLLAWPLGGIAQPAGRMARIGLIGLTAPDPAVLSTWVEPLRQGLRCGLPLVLRSDKARNRNKKEQAANS